MQEDAGHSIEQNEKLRNGKNMPKNLMYDKMAF